MHEGFPIEEKRCFICKSQAHTSRECTCPGGHLDPDRQKHWDEYKARRATAAEAGKTGKGAKGGKGGKGSKGDTGKGKGGKGKGGKGGQPPRGQPGQDGSAQARARADAFVDMARAAAASFGSPTFPRNGVAMDSWANVWLRHKKSMPEAYFQDTLRLAHGECLGRRDVGDKGVPVVWLPWDATQENIDLFPEGFLWERGCSINRGEKCWILTPKMRRFEVKMWHTLPFVSKDDLHQILLDLPAANTKGRSGESAPAPTAARVARACVDLDHVRGLLGKEELVKIRAKYRVLPDLYWKEEKEDMVTPARFADLGPSVVQQPKSSQLAKLWELCAGSAALSARARERRMAHLPPVDLRYGWFTHRRTDQELILYGVLVIGVQCVTAAPNCALWGTMTANMDKDLLHARRQQEEPGLFFLALVCFLQYLMGRLFIVESSGASKIFMESALKCLQELQPHTSQLDQCMYGAAQGEVPIRKHSKFVSDFSLTGMNTRCDKTHSHQQLRGSGPQGSRTASAAQYPTKLCDAILDSITASRSTPQDGGRRLPSAHVFRDPPGFDNWSKAGQVAYRLQELRAVAQQLGHQDLFDELCGPIGFPSNRVAAVGIPSAPVESSVKEIEAPKPEGTSSGGQVKSGSSPLKELTSAVSSINETLIQLMADRKSGWAGNTTSGPSGHDPWADNTSGVEAPPLRAAPVIAEEVPAGRAEPPAPAPEEAGGPPRDLPDLFKGDIPEEPWQERRYSADNRIWQAAAMRRRAHVRRSNVSLGVCTVDLSGPHEPSPRPGNHIHFDTVSYFLVLIVRPDLTGEKVDMAVQTGEDEPAPHIPQTEPAIRPLLYAALLGSKAEAAEAVKTLLAKVNDDHGGLPQELVFRLHSDKGG